MDIIASPSVRAHARTQGVTLEAVAQATGRTRLSHADIDAHLVGTGAAAGAATALPASDDRRFWAVDHAAHGPVSETPLSRLEKVAADNLSAAHRQIPSVTHHDRADMRAVEAFRANIKAEAAARGVRLTALAFHIKALARCLREIPRFNASLSADGESLVLKAAIHVGIAVDTPHGLMVPVIRHADRLGLFALAARIADLAGRAQARKVKPEEMGGASMSVSNLGGIGGTAFTPIVNPPEVAILGLTRTETVPVWEQGAWQPVPMVPLDLTYDHRVINGADAARFLSRYARLLADPRRLIL